MHICIDGRSISHPQRGGFKTYSENLVAALAAIETEHTYTVFYDRPYSFPPVAGHPRFREAILPAKAPLVGQVYREQVAIPIYSRKTHGALWHFPYNTAPLAGVRSYVLTLHDVTPFTHAAQPDWRRPRQALKEVALYYYPRFLMKQAARRAAAIITVSHYARGRICELFGIAPDKVVVTHLAAKPLFRPFTDGEKREARPLAAARYRLDKPFLLTVASSLLKNPQGTVQAYAGLPPDLRARCDLVVVMAYPRFADTIRALAQQLGVAGNVHLLLALQPEELLTLYNLAEVLVYPSFTESFPLPTAEAMACGVPIVCANDTGFPEQVGDAAIMVNPADTEGITSALTRILSDETLKTRMRQASLQRSGRFSWQATAHQTVSVYESVRARRELA